MRKLILFELIILVLATTFESDSPPGWFQQVMPRTDVIIQDIYFIDSLNGWSVARKDPSNDSSFIFKTSNGGENWTISLKENIYLT